MIKWAAAFLVTWTSIASAAPSVKELTATLTAAGDEDSSKIQFGFDSTASHPSPTSWGEADRDRRDLTRITDPIIATSTDGTAVWAALLVRSAPQCAGLAGTLAQCDDPKQPSLHVLLLLDRSAKTWSPIAVHSALPLTDKAITQLVADGVQLAPLPKQASADAAPAVAAFSQSLGDPKLLAASVSDRKDAVLFGSAPGERVVGGKAVAAQLASWKLALTARDGIAAGTSSSKNVAWVAANVDARPFGKPDAKPASYRVLALYERTGAAWKLVAIEFSYPTARNE